jgi:N utilization substance protein B
MANRHLSRSIVLQALSEWDFRGMVTDDPSGILAHNIEEFAPGVKDASFMEALMKSVMNKREQLDKIIVEAAPDWPIEKISVVDRNVLRLGLYELLFADRKEVPAKVAINEAIELAKTYGGENSGKFINGVLGAIYKEIGEPGKDEISKRKKVRIKDVPYEKMPLEQLGGAVVYAREGSDIYLALVHDIFGHWTLSKGRMILGEDPHPGTIRKIKEEIGVDIDIKEKLGENEYIANDPEIGKKRKNVTYFLAETKYEDLKLEEGGGLDDARWFKLSEIVDLNFYDDILPLVTKAVNILLDKK